RTSGRARKTSPGSSMSAAGRRRGACRLEREGGAASVARRLRGARDADRKAGDEVVIRRQQLQPAAAAQRVGRRGHRLEADVLGAGRGKHLSAGVALEKHQLEPSSRVGAEASVWRHAVKPVIEGLGSERTAPVAERRTRYERYLLRVADETAHR